MLTGSASILLALYRIAWPPFLIWVYELRSSLYSSWEKWLDLNADGGAFLLIAIAGSFLWVAVMLLYEGPGMVATYRRHMRPNVWFKETEHHLYSSPEIRGDQRYLTLMHLELHGYFENRGGIPATVVGVTTQLQRNFLLWWIPSGRQHTAAITEWPKGDHPWIADHRGLLVPAFARTDEIIGDSHISLTDEFVDAIRNKGGKYVIKIGWETLGHPVRALRIKPDWGVLLRHFEYVSQTPIPHSRLAEN